MGVALRYTLLGAYTVNNVNTVYTIKTAYAAETVACVPLYIDREG